MQIIRRRGPLRRVSLIRLGVTMVIVTTAVLALTLPGGAFRFIFRGALFIGAIVMIGSYAFEWWIRRRRA